jgi:outer membrane protein OmpA-like peptidoglycan-associated protein
MAFKNKLLATAAIPLIALTGIGPSFAAGFARPSVVVSGASDVIAVQSEEELLKEQQRKERREERRKQRNEQGANDGNDNGGQDNGNRKRQKQAEQEQMQQDDAEPVKPRRNRQAVEEVQPDANEAQEEVTPRRKQRDRAQAQEEQQDNAGQNAAEEEVTPRRKQRDRAQAQEEQQDNAGQNATEEEVTPRRKQRDRAQAQEEQQDNAGQNAAEEEVTPRRKQRDNAAADDGPSEDDVRRALQEKKNQGERRQRKDQADNAGENNGSIEEIETPRRKRQQDGDDQGQRQADNPERVKKRQQIASDPSKSTDTIELPVENGAAVLDSDKDADNADGDSRERRKRQREEIKQVRVPKTDEDAQAGFKGDKNRPIRLDPVLSERGERFTGFKGYDDLGGRRVGRGDDDRIIINIDGRVIIRGGNDDRLNRAGDIRYERLGEGRIREVIVRPDGDRIVTIRNRYGEIIRRSRIDRQDREVVIFFSPDLERGRDRLFLRDPGADLPPMRLRIPVSDYIVDVSGGDDRDYEEFLDLPPVEPVERVYSVDEVKYSARIRDKMRRIDLDTITFETGSADVSDDQATSLTKVGNAVKDLLDRDPGETFLIEGHTDAVGSDESNLILSDSRAESVASVLSELFEIPAENLVTQGYGERYLKIDSDGPVRENRRVTIRRITPLVRPVAAVE